jgi:hypothetical protein
MPPEQILMLIGDLSYAIHELANHLQNEHIMGMKDGCPACEILKEKLSPRDDDTHFHVFGGDED